MTRMFLLAFVVFFLDQASKLYVLGHLRMALGERIEVFPPYLNLVFVWNEGINFGLISGGSDTTRWVLIAVALGITGWVIWWMGRETGVMARISGGFLVGGALGNVVDRVLYGAVADFLNLSCCGFENPYSFNVADISIFIGAIGLVLFTGEKKPRDAS